MIKDQIYYLPMGTKYWKWHIKTFTASAIAKWIRSRRWPSARSKHRRNKDDYEGK